MGVYNPQMKMPIGCHRCDYYDTCKTSNKSVGRYNGERCPDCPLVEVKTPHGRLIDEDKIELPTFVCAATKISVMDAITEAEVIEAEME